MAEEEKNRMVMKKAEDGANADNMQVKTPVMSGDAVIMREPVSDAPAEAAPAADLLVDPVDPNDTTMVSNKTTGVVSIFAPEDTDQIKAEMEEVSYEDYIKSKQVGLTSPNVTDVQTATERVKSLIDGTAADARAVLEDMKNKKQVASFRFIPIGMPMSMELEPGRVQVLCDASKKVIDVSIS